MKMKLSTLTKPLAEVAADALVIGLSVEDAAKLPAALAALDAATGGRLRDVLDAEKFQARPGRTSDG